MISTIFADSVAGLLWKASLAGTLKKISFTDNKKTYNYIEKVRALGLSNFEHYLSAANMKVVNIFGNYNLEKFDEKKSDRLI